MSHDEFTRLFTYMEKGFAEIRTEFARMNAKFDTVYGIIDNHEKRIETLEVERLASNAQLDRHEARLAHIENKNPA